MSLAIVIVDCFSENGKTLVATLLDVYYAFATRKSVSSPSKNDRLHELFPNGEPCACNYDERGDVPALMPIAAKFHKVGSLGWSEFAKTGQKSLSFNTTADQIIHGRKNDGGTWFSERDGKKSARNDPRGKLADGIKQGGRWWHDPNGLQSLSSRSSARKHASAMIAKIPFPLAQHIARYVPNPTHQTR